MKRRRKKQMQKTQDRSLNAAANHSGLDISNQQKIAVFNLLRNDKD